MTPDLFLIINLVIIIGGGALIIWHDRRSKYTPNDHGVICGRCGETVINNKCIHCGE